jgi:O-antigen/teichoic acid export membrane protein
VLRQRQRLTVRSWRHRILDRIRHRRDRLLPAGTLRHRLATASFWSLMGMGVAQACALAMNLVTARLLGVGGYGQLAIVLNTMGLLGIFAGLGLGLTSTKYVAELRSIDPERAGVILGLVNRVVLWSGAAMAAILFLLAPALATGILNAPQLVLELRIGCLLLFFNEINGVQIGSLAGYEAFRRIAAVNLLRGLAGLPIGVAGAWLFGLRGAVVAAVVAAAIGMALSHVALDREAKRHGIKITTHGMRREASILWHFSLPAFIASAVIGPVGWVGNAMLVNTPGGYGQLGIYNAASQWRTTVTFLPQVLGQAALPILSSLWGSGRGRSTRRVLMMSVATSAVSAIPVAIVLIFASDFIMSLYGPGFAGNGAVLAVVALSVVLLTIQMPVGQMVAATGRMWVGAAMNVAWSAVFIVAVVLFLSHGMGALGFALAGLVAYCAHCIWTILFVLRLPKLPEQAPPELGVSGDQIVAASS